jgi:hypothetical protein
MIALAVVVGAILGNDGMNKKELARRSAVWGVYYRLLSEDARR